MFSKAAGEENRTGVLPGFRSWAPRHGEERHLGEECLGKNGKLPSNLGEGLGTMGTNCTGMVVYVQGRTGYGSSVLLQAEDSHSSKGLPPKGQVVIEGGSVSSTMCSNKPCLGRIISQC